MQDGAHNCIHRGVEQNRSVESNIAIEPGTQLHESPICSIYYTRHAWRATKHKEEPGRRGSEDPRNNLNMGEEQHNNGEHNGVRREDVFGRPCSILERSPRKLVASVHAQNPPYNKGYSWSRYAEIRHLPELVLAKEANTPELSL